MMVVDMKLILGVATNDAPYQVIKRLDGKVVFRCPYYRKWTAILVRAYSDYYHIRRPTYSDVTLCDEWLLFSNFKSWMESQQWEGMVLDKDIIAPGNKVYSPDNCVFVTVAINSLLPNSAAVRGDLPVGITFANEGKAFRARVCDGDSKRIDLGCFASLDDAVQAYNKAKSDIILQIASEQTDERIINGLKLHAQLYLNGEVK